MRMFSTTEETQPMACRLGVQNQLILLFTAVPEQRWSVNSSQNIKSLSVRRKTATSIDSCWTVIAKQKNPNNKTPKIKPPKQIEMKKRKKLLLFAASHSEEELAS